MFDIKTVILFVIAGSGIVSFLVYLILYAVAWWLDSKEQKEYIEERNHHEHEQMQAAQEATERSIVHLTSSVEALEKLVRVSNGLVIKAHGKTEV